MAITRLWFFTLRPNISATDPAFTKLWTDVLELCATYTPSPGPSSSPVHVAQLSQPCPKRAHHFLFQSTSPSSDAYGDGAGAGAGAGAGEPIFVLISSYPSLALCSQADAVYAQRYQPQVFKLVRHRALRQMDLEDSEVVPALLSGSPKAVRGVANGSDAEADADAEPWLTATISSRDPLKSEVAESLSSGRGRRILVPPPDEEISGADVYEPPLAPVSVDGEDGGGERDVFAAQRGEGRRWIRISRRPEVGDEDGDVEVFKLRELLSR